jgi:hypothetical protein
LIYKYGDDVARERVFRPGECDTVLDEACENIGAVLESD